MTAEYYLFTAKQASCNAKYGGRLRDKSCLDRAHKQENLTIFLILRLKNTNLRNNKQ